jgi:hypothetical protein
MQTKASAKDYGKRSLRRPKLSTRKFSAWKKKKQRSYFNQSNG